jgi:hypothetical protein
MKHFGTYARHSGQQLIEHEAGTMTTDPLGDFCPLCADPVRGCPVNGFGRAACLERHKLIADGSAYGSLAAACAVHGVPASWKI